MRKQISKHQREKEIHIMRPPRLKGVVRNLGIKPIRKKKKSS